MGKLDDIVEFCLHSYREPQSCARCAYGNCMNEGTSDCYKCLKKLHDVGNAEYTYSCENMTYCYILKHIERYASEIEYVWNMLPMNKAKSDIHFASIGTGASPELYSVVDYIEKNPINVNFTFVGFDHNPIWRPIWDYNMANIAGVSYQTSDFFSYYETQAKPNVLILSYVLSDMVRKNQFADTKAFLDNLVTFIVSMPKVLVIMNDIPYFGGNFYNLRTAYVCMEYLAQSLTKKEANLFAIKRYSFCDYNYWTSGYGAKHSSNGLIAKTTRDISAFAPFSYCNSIQMLIVKKR